MKNPFGHIAAFAAMLAVLTLAGCGKLKREIEEVKVTDVSLRSFTPEGTRAASAVLDVTVDNPAIQFTISDLQGTVFREGDEFAFYTADPVTVKGRKSATYAVVCHARLSDAASLLDVMGLAASKNFDGLTTSVSAKVSTRAGFSKSVSKEGLSISSLIEKAK